MQAKISESQFESMKENIDSYESVYGTSYIPLKIDLEETIVPNFYKSLQLKTLLPIDDYKKALWNYKIENVDTYIYYFLWVLKLIKLENQVDFYKETQSYIWSLINDAVELSK